MTVSTEGIVAILAVVVLAAVGVRNLRKVDFRLQKLGFYFGLEADDERTSGVRIGDISGEVHGDIAGRDINKNFNQTLQKILAGGSQAVRIHVTERVRILGNDRLKSRLQEIGHGDDGWFWRYVEECLQDHDFRGRLHDALDEMRSRGLEPTSINVDNIQGGLHLNIDCAIALPERSTS